MLLDIANSAKPIHKLVEHALTQKGAMSSPDIVARYASMLETAIYSDEGEDTSDHPWDDFVQSLPGHSKFEGAVMALGQALNASSAEISQFIHLADGVVDVISGANEDEVQARLDAKAEYEDRLLETDPAPYQHLDENSRADRLEQDAYLQSDNNEPSHIDDGGEE